MRVINTISASCLGRKQGGARPRLKQGGESELRRASRQVKVKVSIGSGKLLKLHWKKCLGFGPNCTVVDFLHCLVACSLILDVAERGVSCRVESGEDHQAQSRAQGSH